jgi:hypothetical protein
MRASTAAVAANVAASLAPCSSERDGACPTARRPHPPHVLCLKARLEDDWRLGKMGNRYGGSVRVPASAAAHAPAAPCCGHAGESSPAAAAPGEPAALGRQTKRRR